MFRCWGGSVGAGSHRENLWASSPSWWNVGKSPTKIHDFWFQTANGKSKVQIDSRFERQQPPCEIEAHGRVTWWIHRDALTTLTKRLGSDLLMLPVIEWGPDQITKGRLMRLYIEHDRAAPSATRRERLPPALVLVPGTISALMLTRCRAPGAPLYPGTSWPSGGILGEIAHRSERSRCLTCCQVARCPSRLRCIRMAPRDAQI